MRIINLTSGPHHTDDVLSQAFGYFRFLRTPVFFRAFRRRLSTFFSSQPIHNQFTHSIHDALLFYSFR